MVRMSHSPSGRPIVPTKRYYMRKLFYVEACLELLPDPSTLYSAAGALPCQLGLVCGGQQRNAVHMDFLLAFAGLGNAIGRLHPHQRVHLRLEGFFDAERHIPGEVGLAVEQAGQRRLGNAQRCGGRRDGQSAASMISVRMKSPGWSGFFIGMIS